MLLVASVIDLPTCQRSAYICLPFWALRAETKCNLSQYPQYSPQGLPSTQEALRNILEWVSGRMNELMPGTSITWKCSHPWITQCFSNVSVQMNHLGFLVKCRNRFEDLGWSLRVCISNKLPGDSNAAGPLSTLWEARDYTFQMSTLPCLKVGLGSPRTLDIDCLPLVHFTAVFSGNQLVPLSFPPSWGWEQEGWTLLRDSSCVGACRRSWVWNITSWPHRSRPQPRSPRWQWRRGAEMPSNHPAGSGSRCLRALRKWGCPGT